MNLRELRAICLGHEIRVLRDSQISELNRKLTLTWAAYGKHQKLFVNFPLELFSTKQKMFNLKINTNYFYLPPFFHGYNTGDFNKYFDDYYSFYAFYIILKLLTTTPPNN